MTVGLYASCSPDRHYVACFSGYGIFVMNLDGTGATTLLKDLGGIPGTVSWIPWNIAKAPSSAPHGL
jgi:hypothetical protein